MRKLTFALILPLAACSTFGWESQGAGVTEEQQKRGIKSVAAMSREYETQTFFRNLRRRSDGRNNAFGRDLMAINDFFDKHFWNYDQNDPMVNYPSDTTKLDHFARFSLTVISGVPGVDEITNR